MGQGSRADHSNDDQKVGLRRRASLQRMYREKLVIIDLHRTTEDDEEGYNGETWWRINSKTASFKIYS